MKQTARELSRQNTRAVMVRWAKATPEERTEAARRAALARYAGKSKEERKIENARGTAREAAMSG